MTIIILEDECHGKKIDPPHELARFSSNEVTRLEVVHSGGTQRWILEGQEWRVEDV